MRILVSIPSELHDLLKELAVRNKTSMSKLILAAVEDTYEDEIDAIAGERGLAEHLADPSSSVSWDEVKEKLRAQALAAIARQGANGANNRGAKRSKSPPPKRKKIGISR